MMGLNTYNKNFNTRFEYYSVRGRIGDNYGMVCFLFFVVFSVLMLILYYSIFYIPYMFVPNVNSFSYIVFIIFKVFFIIGKIGLFYFQFLVNFIWNNFTSFFILAFFIAKLVINYIFLMLFILYQICLTIVYYLLDLIRVIFAITLTYISDYDVRKVGLELRPLFLYRQVIGKDMAQAGIMFFAPYFGESAFLQLISISAQICWVMVLVIYWLYLYVEYLVFAGMFTISVVGFVIINYLNFWVWVCIIISMFIYFGIQLKFIVFFNRFKNFMNFQTLFNFILPNKWFGLNVLSVRNPINSIINLYFQVRVRLLESLIWRLETFIFFTSHLRIDPKVVDIHFW